MIKSLPLLLSLFSIATFTLAQTQEYVDYWDADETQKRSEGVYERGLENGEWNFWYASGQLKETAQYAMGYLNGKVTRYYQNGQISEEGWFKKDVQDSLMTTWNRSGKTISKGYYLNGRKFKEWAYHTKTGEVYQKEEYDSAGVKSVLYFKDKDGNVLIENGNGFLKEFYPSGMISFIYPYSEGKIKGKFIEFYPTGDTAATGYYNGEIKTGEWIVWNLSGSVTMVSHYKNNVLDGSFLINYDHGKPKTTGIYNQGKKTGLWLWYFPDGNLDMEGNFTDDQPDGEWKYYHPNEVVYYT
ncbi:MAG TPA: hypothetical protein ENL09_00610, partial [Bacteroidetes bacterium]|nr:hypothetical protein [Bacteroidota bacterium]